MLIYMEVENDYDHVPPCIVQEQIPLNGTW